MKRVLSVLLAGLLAGALALTGCPMPNGDTTGGGGKTLVSIKVTKLPDKTEYNLNEELDTAGMEVTATYSDRTSEKVTGYETRGFDSATAGNKTVTVTWQGKTDTFTVNVVNPSKPTVATPTAAPDGGLVISGMTVTLETTTDGAEIWYTTDGQV